MTELYSTPVYSPCRGENRAAQGPREEPTGGVRGCTLRMGDDRERRDATVIATALLELATGGTGAIPGEPEGHLAREQAALTERGDLGVPHRLAREDPRQDEVERRRLGEHPAGGHADDLRLAPVRDQKQAAGVRGRAVPFHPPPHELQGAEDRIQRIQSARPRDDEEVGAFIPQSLQLLGDGLRASARVADRQGPGAEPVDLLPESRFEPLALLVVQALASQGAERQRLERGDG